MSKPNPGKEFADIWGEIVVSNRHFRLATYALGGVLVLLLVADVRLSSVELPKPIVIRVDDVGRAEALAYEALEAQANPLDPTTRSTSSQPLSATTTHGERRPLRQPGPGRSASWPPASRTPPSAATARPSPPSRLASPNRNARSRRSPSPSGRNRSRAHSAAADFDLVILEDGEEVSRERWSVAIQFTFLPQVPPISFP